jgi:hypothetical protein
MVSVNQFKRGIFRGYIGKLHSVVCRTQNALLKSNEHAIYEPTVIQIYNWVYIYVLHWKYYDTLKQIIKQEW